MATIVLSAVGAAIGSTFSGTVLGLTGAVVGRAVGATIGRVIDQRVLGQGSEPVEVGRMDRFRLSGASEGAPVAQLFGRMRLGGQVIWASNFLETSTTTGGGKGAPAQPKTTTYSYSINLALALCQGEIARVGRVWADGVELERNSLNMRVYRGTEDQMPDPKMEAIEGAGQVPAYRGVAYVVIEDLNLAPFGNRVPQLSFEVVRPAQPETLETLPTPTDAVEAVALMPGTGEYALATTPVSYRSLFGQARVVNVNTPAGMTDLEVSLSDLRGELPKVTSVSLIVSWFGDDLRAGQCSVKPKVEHKQEDGAEMPWTVAGLNRDTAEQIAFQDGRAVYGGTPTDQSVIQAIQAIQAGGQEVLFYPFLLMEILAGNGRPDPWAEGDEQPPLPWRGRITGDKAPGFAGGPDGTSANTAAVAAFFGTASASDFTVQPGSVGYSGPQEWSYRRFILHYAALCAAAGGVEAFCIGSEMRSLTQMRDDVGFPAVEAFRALAAEVRSLLPDAKISYAADWSEYFGYQPTDGSGYVYFHLDPLWADANIDFVAIDNYMPLSDWRDGAEHADVAWGSIYDLDYLQANIEGGEGYDWYYATEEGRAAQIRLPIEDQLGGQPWIFRYKDIRAWWENQHVERLGPLAGNLVPDGATPTDWSGVTGASITPSAEAAFGPLGNPADIASNGGAADRARMDTLDVKADTAYRVTVWVKKQTAPACRILWQHASGIGFVRFDFGTESLFANENGCTVAGETFAYDAARDIYRIEFDVVWPADDSTTFLHVGPNSAVPGTFLTCWGASIAPADPEPTAWIPRSKPIWFTEIGCAAVDKGTNQPNKFLDPKSSESGVPYFSNGKRDDLIQTQYLRAVIGYWNDPENNPVSDVYDGPMVDVSRTHVWAWDARPWPAFPNRQDLWSDGENHLRGHWITGRTAAQPLASVVAEICETAGVTDFDVSRLHGFVRGHVSADVDSGRAKLQSLMLAYGFSAVERDGKLVFLPLPLLPDGVIAAETTAVDEEGMSGVRQVRAPQAETVGRVRLGFTEADGAFETRVAEAIFPDDDADTASQSELPLVLTGAEGQGIAERWLAEARVARDTISFALPPSRGDIGAGSMVALEDGTTWRVDRVEDIGARRVEAVRVERAILEPSDAVEAPVSQRAFVPPVPVSPVFMDLPLLTGEEVAHAPTLAVAAVPWPGSVAAYSSATDNGFTLNRLIDRRAVAGTLETPLFKADAGRWDRGGALRVRISGGALSSASLEDVLNGANAAAIGSGDDGPWEVIQFADATLVAPDTWEIGLRLRGQAGTDGVMPETWPPGSLFVLLDGAQQQLDMALSERGLARTYRVGPARRSLDDPSYVERRLAFDGVGLRPYAPAHLRARKVDDDLAVSWIRRTRIDGDSWQGTEVPLNEESEAYVLRVRNAGVLVREETLSAPTWLYSASAQAQDGLSAPYIIEVAQLSERFGPGPFTRIEIDD